MATACASQAGAVPVFKSEGPNVYRLQKDAPGAFRSARIAARVSEGSVADTLGVEVDKYIDWERGDAGDLEITEEGLTKCAKLFKTTVAALMISALGAAPAPAAAGEGENGNVAGDSTETPTDAAAKAAKEKAAKAEAIAKAKDAGASSQPQARILEVPDGSKVTVGKQSEGREKAQVRSAIAKHLLGVNDFEKVVMKGSIVPEDIAVGGTLSPELGQGLLSLVVEQSDFLKKIQVKTMNAIQSNVNVIDVAARKIRSTPTGWPATTDMSQPATKSLTMAASKAGLIIGIEDETLLNYQGNIAGLENFLIDAFKTTFSNDILDLGFNGTSDGDGSTFLAIAKGWNTRAAELLAAQEADQLIDVSTEAGAADTVLEILDRMILESVQNGNAHLFNMNESTLVVGPEDFERFETEITARAGDSTAFLINGVPKKYRTRAMEIVNYVATNTAYYTKLQNFVLGVVNGNGPGGIKSERFRTPGRTEIHTSMYVDFEFVTPLALVHAKP